MKKMKKHAVSLLLVLCVLVSVVPATGFAMDDYELTEKLLSQPTGSGYSVQSTVKVTGEEMGQPLDGIFRLMRGWDGAQLALNGTGTFTKRTNHYDMDTGIQVTGKNGEELFSLRLMNDNSRVAFASPLMDEQFRGFDKTGLVDVLVNTGVIGSGAATVIRLLPVAGSGDLDAVMGDLIEEVGFWLSAYCSVEQQDGNTILTYSVPGGAIAAEAAWVLEQLRQNEDAAAVLQPVLGNDAHALLFGEKSIDLGNLRMSGPAVLIRSYDASANLTRLDAELPLPEGIPAESVSLTVIPEAEGDAYDVLFTYRDGQTEKITLQKTADGWKGTYVFGDTAFAFTYALTLGTTNYDRSVDQMTQDVNVSVGILPLEGNDTHTMSFVCDLHMSSASDKHGALYVSGKAVLSDSDAGSSAEFDFSGNCLQGSQAQSIDALNVLWLDRDPAEALNMMNLLENALPAGN